MTLPIFYQIKIKGHLDQQWSAWFDDVTITHEANGETLLSGPMVDQAALFGLLLKIHSLNLTLLSLKRVERYSPSPPSPATTD